MSDTSESVISRVGSLRSSLVLFGNDAVSSRENARETSLDLDGLPQLCPVNVACHHYRSCGFVRRCLRRSISANEVAQLDVPSAYCVHALKTFKKSLPGHHCL